MLSEVRLATLGVRNLHAAIKFYTTALQYRVFEQGDVDPALAALWRFDPNMKGRYAVLGADDSGLGRLRLLDFDAPGEPLWTTENRYQASGFSVLNFRCREAADIMQSIVAAGGSAAHEPSYWEVSEQVAVRDSISDDPDGIRLDMFSYERGGEARGPLATEVSVLQTVAITTPDLDRSIAFYKALGFRTLFDRVLDFPGLQTLLGTDRPVVIRNANLMKDGHIVPGRVEMFCYLGMEDLPRISLRDKAVPPHIGILSISMASDDLAADHRQLVALGATPVERSRVTLPDIGTADVATVLGPDGEAMEIYQSIAR